MVRITNKKVEPGNTSSGESRAEDIGVSRDGPQIQVNVSIFLIFCDAPQIQVDISIGLMLIQNTL